jgi:hypothetical protein
MVETSRTSQGICREVACRRILKPKTLEGYRSLLSSRILPPLGDQPLSKVTQADVRIWVAEMVEEGLSALGSSISRCPAQLEETAGDQDEPHP